MSVSASRVLPDQVDAFRARLRVVRTEDKEGDALRLGDNQRFVGDRFEDPAKLGDAGRDILKAERRLAALGFDVGEVDGVFDKDTKAAVKALCADHPELFDARGQINQDVWQALIVEFREQVIEGHPEIDALRPRDTDPGNHAIAILGRTADGKYLIADPLSSGGTIAVSRKALATFLNDGSGDILEVSARRKG